MSTVNPGAPVADSVPAEPVSGGHKPLPRSTLFFYGLSDMPIQMAAIPVAAFLPNYYGQDLGLSLTAVGTIWLIARLFDAVTDPLMGWISDRVPTPFGRRRIWMVAAVPLLMLSIWKLFMPEPPVDEAYFLTWLIVLWTGWTMLFIPYYAWAAEMSADYNERTRITGWRAWIGMAANVVSKLVPVIALWMWDYGGTEATLVLIGTMTIILLPITVGLTVTMVPEPRDFVPARMPILPGLRIMWNNAPFKRLLLAFFVNQFGSAISTALVVFFIRNVLGEESNSITMLLVFYIANLAGIPFWVKISERYGKHRTWASALIAFGCCQCGYLFLDEGDVLWMAPIMAMTGFLGGTFNALPNAMKADVIDVDSLQSGEDRAALFFAVWSFAIKLALSIGPAFALWVLALIGFSSTSPSEEGLLGLKLFYVFGPAAGFTLAALIVWNHPLTATRHAEIRVQLERARAAANR
jgi:Na+/melibiose symporter-like transporter